MATLVYSMHVSLDGFVEDPSGSIEWSGPDDEVHRLANEHTLASSAFLFGRRMYHMMEDYWTTAERDQEGTPTELAFARAYVDTPRVIFSDTLESVPDGCRLVRRRDARAEVTRLRAELGGELGIAGPDLAASFVDLIDEYRLFLVPVVVGGGKPFWPPRSGPLPLRLAEHRIFASGWAYLRYVRPD